jgi:pyrroline-5-carboxylate reductase
MESEITYGLIGVGKMGEPILESMLQAGIKPVQVSFSVRNDERAKYLAEHYGVSRKSNKEIASNVDVLIIGVKPQGINELLVELLPELQKPALLISILAGKKTTYFEEILPKHIRIIRTMPNTPISVGKGVIAASLGVNATAEDQSLLRRIFEKRATIHFIPEELQDAVAAVSGSSPAYFYAFVEALVEAGISAGVPKELSEKLAVETFIGSAELLKFSELSPKTLRENVTSPNGMTFEGLKTLADRELSQAVIAAVEAAKARSIELSK